MPVESKIELIPAIIPQAQRTPKLGTTILVINAAKRFKRFSSVIDPLSSSITSWISFMNSSYTSPTLVPIIICSFPSAS